MELRSLFQYKLRSFSFIELIVVMAVISIIMAALIPTIKNFLPSWQLSGSARLIINKLRQAQEEAVTSQHQYIIRFNPTANPPTFQLIKNDGGETIMENFSLPYNSVLTLDSSITDNEVRFSSDGGPSSSGNIIFNLDSLSKT
ncbi:MAG: ral secretion pathway protein type fimbrial biosis protein FimT, partial [Candidatus Berkelbacteria bacterium]|nr:ral secretion pathway protein type fimbrial biosis protein FimT [Candidatus Berkelbacteria bacterium]